MENKLKVYIISGCCGAGKTTISRELVKKAANTAIISGDVINDLYRDEASMKWNDRLLLIWQNILLLADNFLKNNINVIIDYVVEDELSQILAVIGKYDVELRYIVKTADTKLIKERLIARGDATLVERALFLHQKFNNDINNIHYLYDGSNTPLKQQIEEIMNFKLYK